MTVRGRGVRVSDLAIDGGGRAERDRRRRRVRGRRPPPAHRHPRHPQTGVEVGEHSDISIQDSSIAGDGARGAGIFELGSDDDRDMSVIRTRTSVPTHGINFAQRDYDEPSAALHVVALDNEISNIDDPAAATGNDEGGIWSGGVGGDHRQPDPRTPAGTNWTLPRAA